MAHGIDRAAVERYDQLVAAARPAELETVEVGAGLFGRARVVRPSREEMAHDEEYEVVVAGGGPAGTLCGCLLGKRGHSVLILERMSKLGSGSTWNIAHPEYDELGRTGAFTDEQLSEIITGDYEEGIFRVYDRTAPPPGLRDFHWDEVWNISVDENRFFEFLTAAGDAEIRCGFTAELRRVTGSGAYVAYDGPSGPRMVKCRLFIDARGWTSPLATLIHSEREIESVFNIVGVHAKAKLPRETNPLTGRPIGLIGATYEDEIPSAAGRVQPILERFTDYVEGRVDDGEVLYYFTRTARPTRLIPLADDMLERMHLIAEGFEESDVDRTYYGHIPGYYPPRLLSRKGVQTSAGDRALFVGCSAQQYSGLTGAAFCTLARNAADICGALNEALRADDLSFARLRKVDIDPRERVCQSANSLFAGAMELDDYEEPGTVNCDWISFMKAAEEMDPNLRNEAFRDKLRLKALNQMVGICLGHADAIRALLRNNRGHIGTVVRTFISAYLKLLGLELSLLVRRRKVKYLLGSSGALVRLPVYLTRSARLYAKGCRIDHRKKRKEKGATTWGS